MTIASILALAPSQNMAKRAEILAHATNFLSLTCHNNEFYGTALSLYGSLLQVHFSPTHNRFACTCHIRQQPCFHALALAVIATKLPESFTESEAKNIQAVSNPSTFGNLIPTSQAQSAENKLSRRMQRMERAIDGFEDLDTWLEDVVRRGLGTVYQESPRLMEHIASRMADASLIGLARKMRLWQSQALASKDWSETVLTAIAELKIVSTIFKKRAEITEGLFADLMDYCGINIRKEDVLAEGERISDEWLVVATQEEILEDRIEMRRTWLYGLQTHRFGLLLDFGFGSTGLPPGFEFAQLIKAQLVYYLSEVPIRVLIYEILESKPPNTQIGHVLKCSATSWISVQFQYAQHISKCPWIVSFPTVIYAVSIRANAAEDHFFLEDMDDTAVATKLSSEAYYMLLAFCLGHRFDMLGAWNGEYFVPFAAVYEGKLMKLT